MKIYISYYIFINKDDKELNNIINIFLKENNHKNDFKVNNEMRYSLNKKRKKYYLFEKHFKQIFFIEQNE